MSEYRDMPNPFINMVNPDPIHAMFLKRKFNSDPDNIDLTPVNHNKSDEEELRKFCEKYGIVGVNFGNMSPSLVLRMLKSKMGIVEEPNKTQNKFLLKG